MLDYVDSSNALEGLDEPETEANLREWTRVLRAGGHLALPAHAAQMAKRIGNLDLHAELPEPPLVVFRKTAATGGPADPDLQAALSERDELEVRVRRLERHPVVRLGNRVNRLRRSRSVPTSETSKHRAIVAAFCTGSGLDVGFGGDPVTVNAIRMDLPSPYAEVGDAPVQLGGDCRDLGWFGDDALDYVYSSHVLEDFAEDETEPIMREWGRVLRKGGHLVLLLPDQERYRRHCAQVGIGPNPHHSIKHFSLAYVQEVASRIGNLAPSAETPELGDYSFLAVFRKDGAIEGPADAGLRAALSERDELAARARKLERHPLVRLTS